MTDFFRLVRETKIKSNLRAYTEAYELLFYNPTVECPAKVALYAKQLNPSGGDVSPRSLAFTDVEEFKRFVVDLAKCFVYFKCQNNGVGLSFDKLRDLVLKQVVAEIIFSVRAWEFNEKRS